MQYQVTLPDRPIKGETSKAQPRRLREGWFDRYCSPMWFGIDIGSGPDPLFIGEETWRLWDREDGDATFMASVHDNFYDVAYASHILEDMDDPATALKNWYRIIRPGGHLIVLVPHRDRYERRKELPSLFNGAHRSFWLPDRAEPPVTRSMFHEFKAALPEAELLNLRVLEDDWAPCPPEQHAGGEYSIELIARKPF
jgi:SAM-dependent methyltransferase